MTSRRIGFVNDTAQLGGIEIMMLLLVRHLPRDRYTPVYIAPEPGPMVTEMQALGVEVVIVPRSVWWSISFYLGHRKVFNPFALIHNVVVMGPYILRLAAALRRARIDIVHSAGVEAHIFAGLAARRAGILHLAHIQDIISRAWTRTPYTKFLDRVSDQFVAISTPVGAYYPAHKTTLIPNAVDLSRWHGTVGIRENLGLLPQHKVIAIIGRLTPWKGQRVFLAAAQILAAQDPCYRFLIVGDDSLGGVSGYRAELEGLASQENLQDRVQFLGRRDDVLDVMAACDVIVHASTKPEPFGVVIIEGMAMAKPVIATAIGGPLDIIEDKVDGLLTPPGDAQALAETIQFLISNPDAAKHIAERAQEKSQTYSIAAMVERFGKVYDSLRASSP